MCLFNLKKMEKMYVLKRDGRRENVMFDKITSRIKKLCYGLNMEYIDEASITFRVINQIYPGISTVELDNLAAKTAATMTSNHPHYAILAARIAISNLHKETKKNFSDTMKDLYEMKNDKTGLDTPMVSDEVYQIIMNNKEVLDSTIIYDRDFGYEIF